MKIQRYLMFAVVLIAPFLGGAASAGGGSGSIPSFEVLGPGPVCGVAASSCGRIWIFSTS
jgi:hypothetical protein